MVSKAILTTAAVIALGASTVATAGQLKMRSLEDAIEADTSIVSVPESVPTSLSLKPCGDCKFLTLSVPTSTRFYVGKDEVSLKDLRRYANRGQTNFDVFYDRKTKQVRRMVLRTQLDAADAATRKRQ